MCKISVIVPIYNVKEFLAKCITSIREQTLNDIEIILACDGPEDCHTICDSYASKDSRIKIIKNLGSYGKSINTGIKIATGEYIGIVEADDWIDKTMYEKLYRIAKDNDTEIAKCSFWYAYNDMSKTNCNNAVFVEKDKIFTLEDFPKALLFRQTIWSAIYKKDFLLKNNIRMIEQRISFRI